MKYFKIIEFIEFDESIIESPYIWKLLKFLKMKSI